MFGRHNRLSWQAWRRHWICLALTTNYPIRFTDFGHDILLRLIPAYIKLHFVASGEANRKFILVLRIYPLALLAVLGVLFLLGGFSDQPDATISRAATYTFLTILLAVVPLGFMIAFIIIGNSSDRRFLQNSTAQEKFEYGDAFTLSHEEMRGFKIALIRGKSPTLTGITGDSYKADDSAVCPVHPEHVPPVQNCQCGFHAFKDYSAAKFELTLYKNSFLLDVDLYGVGFVYSRGFRAETQVVNLLRLPRRCMNCKIFNGKRFTSKYQLGYDFSGWWQWDYRCSLCSSFIKKNQQMEIAEMREQLGVLIQ
jgi:hypothetical protein